MNLKTTKKFEVSNEAGAAVVAGGVACSLERWGNWVFVRKIVLANKKVTNYQNGACGMPCGDMLDEVDGVFPYTYGLWDCCNRLTNREID